MKHCKFKTQAAALAILASMFTVSSTEAESNGYEIWGSDQSNSVANVDGRGVSGSWLWVWDSKDVEVQLKGGQAAKPLGCNGKNIPGEGPCNLYDVFPSTLVENDSNGPTGKNLSELPGFGRLHGMLPDPQNLYMNVNIFAPDGGYIGIIDGETKEAVALFRVTGTNIGRSVHMSFWSSDGSALLVANLHGKVLERIDLERNKNGQIISATFNKSASLGVGKEMTITDEAKVYLGTNSQGNPMLGNISGSYDEGKYLVVALRGPIPVSVAHAAQGICPGVGMIELLDGGASGRLVGVLRTTNIVDNSPMSAPGGHEYTGSEYSDIHGASVRQK